MLRPRKKFFDGMPPFDIIEEAFHLVRLSPPRALLAYFIGSAPFVLALLFFWADMGKSADAHITLPRAAIALAILFPWMKTWQSIYAGDLRRQLLGDEPPRPSLIRFMRLAARQAAIQPIGLFAMTITLPFVIFFPGAYAFFQNFTVMDDGEKGTIRDLVGRALYQASLWKRQNAVIIWVLSPILVVAAAGVFLVLIPSTAAASPDWADVFIGLFSFIFGVMFVLLSPFGILVAVNVGVAISIMPTLLHMLLGVSTPYHENPGALYNASFYAVTCGVTYLCMDPFIKAAYVLRCFYGSSLKTGEDLKIEIKRLSHKRTRATLAAVLFALTASTLFSPSLSLAQDNDQPGEKVAAGSRAEELDRAIASELEERRYKWRMPRIAPEEREGIISSFLRGLSETIKKWGKTAGEWLKDIRDWFRDLFPQRQVPLNHDGSFSMPDFSGFIQVLFYVLVAVVLCVAAIFLLRLWQKRGEGETHQIEAEAMAAPPDLEDERTTAADLPEDEWIALARELMEKAEFRLALRAVFLATLAQLSRDGLVFIAKFKSNRDYMLELARRSHEAPELLETFSESARVFESVWYGTHPADRAAVDEILARRQRLRINGARQ